MDIGSKSARDGNLPDPARSREWRGYYFYGALLVLLVSLPITWLVRSEILQYMAAKRSQQSMVLMGLMFQAYESVSAERGPANAMLTVTSGTDYRLRQQRLVSMRQQSDQRLETLATALADNHCSRCPAMRTDLDNVRKALTRGRAAFDALYLDTARQQRPGAILAAVEDMFRATQPFSPMLGDISYLVTSNDPETTNLVVLARLAAEFREYAGRLGSVFTEALVTGRDFNAEDARDVAVIQGRIYQLRDFLMVRVAAAQDDTRLRTAVDRLKGEYLDTSLEMVMELRSMPMSVGKAPMTPAQFADMYVPGMASIVTLRDTAFSLATDDARARRRSLATQAVVAVVLGVLGEVLVIWVVFSLRGRYVARLAQFASAMSMLQAERPGSYGREEVLSELTHDMKSPQAGIIALLELARSTDAYQSNPELFFRIEGYARRTLKMVDDFVQMSQTQSVRHDTMEVDLHGALLDATENLLVLARAKQIRLEVAETDGEPYTVYGCPELLVRAITNVVENAIKYSPLNARVLCSLGRDGRWTLLTVSDTGYGIRGEDIPHVFGRYRRFRAPGQPRVAGTGLGLAFVKDVVSQMRGKVTCRSTLGAGTAFTLRFPVERSLRDRLRLRLAGLRAARQP